MSSAIVHLPDELAVALRPYEPADRSYILSSMKGTLKNSPALKWARDGEIYRMLNHRCDSLLTKHGALVACNPEKESQLLGWAILERPGTCHFVYVKRDFRKNGIAKALLGGLQEPISASFWTQDCEWAQRHLRIEYRPSLVEQ